jgi:diguanylate cyclase (GGDEF)-like protein/PAS domain S-box-containing protein
MAGEVLRLDGSPLPRGLEGRRLLGAIAALAIVYVVVGKLGLMLAFLHASASPVWPTTGLALAAFLMLGHRVWPGIFAGAFLVNLTTVGTASTSLGIATGNTLEGLVGAWLVERFAGGDRAFDRTLDVFKFAALAGMASTTLSATIGVTSLSLGGFAPWATYPSIWLTWWLGDVVGDLVAGPLLILWWVRPLPKWRGRRSLEAALLLASLLGVGLLIFGGWLPAGLENSPLEFLCLPFVLWAAFRFTPREAATATALISGIAIWGALHGRGPFVRASPNESLLLLQAFVGVTGVTTLAIAAAVAARRAAEDAFSRIAAIVASSEDAIISKSLEGRITSWNAGAERLYGHTLGEARGQSVSLLIPRDFPDEMPDILERVRGGETIEPYETVRVAKDGRRLEVSLQVSPIRGSAGRISGVSTIARDITARKRAERRLATQFAVTRALGESGTLSEAAPRLLRALCEGLEWDAGELWQADTESGALRCAARYAPATTSPPSRSPDLVEPGDGLAERARKSGRPVWDLRGVLAWPLCAGGEFAGVVALYSRQARAETQELTDLMSDIGVRIEQFVEREKTLRGLTRLKKAVETVEMGLTISDMNGRILYTNPAEAVMHGYRTDELIGKHVSIFMPQEWRPASPSPPVAGSWRRETVNARRDGTVFPVQLLSDPVIDANGQPIGMVTYCEEITERKHAEEVLRTSEERYRLLFERNLAGVYRSTPDGRLLECNEAFARILGYSSREELLGRTAWDLFFSRRDRDVCLARLREHGTLENFEVRMRRKDGSSVWVLENETLRTGSQGEVVEGTLIDISDRKLVEAKTAFHAYHDALTGLPNRTFFRDRLSQALAKGRKSGWGLGVVFLDLDHFKEVNDTLGHAVGDRLLQEVATRLKESVREDDLVARLGGDEFVVLLPHVRQKEGAARIVRKVLARMEEPFRLAGQEVHLTTSAGIALFPQNGKDPDTLLANADAAMYRAKDLGRNAFQFWDPSTPPHALDGTG